jgi:acetyl esterase/lipase
MQSDVDYWLKEIEKKQDLIVRAKIENKTDLIDKFNQFIKDATKKVISIKEDIARVESQIANPAWFRDHGIIGIQADYRVKSRQGTTPIECIEDAKSAVRYIRAHAKKLGIDPNKIIVAGGSAGGHIAACTFIEGGDAKDENLKISSKPNVLVLHNPVLGEGFGMDFFILHPEFSPILHINKGWPPTILSNGTKDETTPIQTAEKFTKLMKEAGNVCELISVKDAAHSCDWPVSNPNFLPTMQRITDFLRTQKFIE